MLTEVLLLKLPKILMKVSLVPMTGLEPALPKKTDFESVASTNSATSACSLSKSYKGKGYFHVELIHLADTLHAKVGKTYGKESFQGG